MVLLDWHNNCENKRKYNNNQCRKINAGKPKAIKKECELFAGSLCFNGITNMVHDSQLEYTDFAEADY